MDVNIQKYQAFLKAVEYGSFTKAAEALSYSQSGISRMIGDLEQEWNIILLERGRSGVRLTSDGLRLLPYAQNVCAEYNKLQMQVDELHGLQSGLIRIGTFSSVATHWLPNIIQQFQKDFPNIDFELLLGDYAEIDIEPQAEQVVIHIKDGGPGIPDAELDAVLQPFYRIETSRNRDTGGTGLGLAIAAQLTAQLDGKLHLANRTEGGLEVSVTLPRR